MKLLDFFRGLFKSRDKPTDSYLLSTAPFLFGKSISGKFVDEFSAMRVSAVYACVRILAESIAALPLHVYEYKNGGKERAINHPLYFLLHDAPNSEMTSFNFRESSMSHLLLRGNAYSQIIRDGLGKVVGLYLLQPNRMTVERDDNGEIVYRYTPTTGENSRMKNSAQVILSRRDVLHIPALGFDGIIGYSPIAMARNAIGVAIACEEFGAKFFENGARPSGILEHPGTIQNPEKLRESWQSVYGGSGNTGKVAILEEGMKYQQISIPPNDAQFLDTRKFQLNEIARIFRVPPHMLADLERATFSNVTQQSLEFVMYTLTPWIVRWEQALNKALFSPNERGKFFVKFNVDGLLRGDYETRIRGYSTAIQNGIMSVNEVRELEDMNPLTDAEGGNLHLINGNVAKLQDAGAAYSQKAGEQAK
ncbi:MAG: phage portal protein [Selenomonadaceae bacterium]|nr:phage portal protein [Selenomonadaceae bacterium]MBR4383890.1 phage portal protein [Selenomonadaceae bacterium]